MMIDRRNHLTWHDSVFEAGRAWCVRHPLDVESMQVR
jgi:hypothetical protein